MYVINGKSNTGPNPDNLNSNTAGILAANALAAAASAASNQYQFQLEQASLVSAGTPSDAQLVGLTRQVAQNNNYWLSSH